MCLQDFIIYVCIYLSPFVFLFIIIPLIILALFLCCGIISGIIIGLYKTKEFLILGIIIGVFIYMFFECDVLSSNFCNTIISGIFAGILASFIYAQCVKLPDIVKGMNFKKIFGREHWDDFKLICGTVKSVNSGINAQKNGTQFQFSVPTYIPESEVTASNYLKSSIAKNLQKNGTIIADTSCQQITSFCSFGGMNNIYSQMVLFSSRNGFYSLGSRSMSQPIPKLDIFIRKEDGAIFPSQVNGIYDYGVIIKIKDGNSDSVHICSFGLGHSGTRGCAYFLANKWKELKKIVGEKEFGCIVRVVQNNDASAEIVDIVVGKH